MTEGNSKNNNELLLCWKCKRVRPDRALFCAQKTCGILQAPLKQTHFELLGLSPIYDIDTRLLERRYYNLHKKVHPDYYNHSSPTEKQYSATYAAVINEAYTILKDPVLRAKYLLALQGIIIDNEGDTISNHELLSNILETRQQIEEAEDDTILTRLSEENETAFMKCVSELSKAFSKSNYQEAKALTIRLIYLQNIQHRIITKRPTS